MWKPLCATILALCVAFTAFAADKDGFPTGNDTPEGAACDLARAFIRDDAALFLATCVEPHGTPEERLAYHKFLEGVVVQMKMDPAGRLPTPEAPRSIAKCFAARHFSKLGPAAYGSTTLGYQDVMFVDVAALLQNGGTQLCRTLVVKTKQGKWVVDPQPEQTPQLSEGLDDESPSTREFAGASPAK